VHLCPESGRQTFGVGGGAGTINITVNTGCPWSVASNAELDRHHRGNAGMAMKCNLPGRPKPWRRPFRSVTVAGLLSFTVEEADAFLSTLTSAGSIAHLASAGYWTTAITLVNTSSSAAQVRLNFFDNNGQPTGSAIELSSSVFAGGWPAAWPPRSTAP